MKLLPQIVQSILWVALELCWTCSCLSRACLVFNFEGHAVHWKSLRSLWVLTMCSCRYLLSGKAFSQYLHLESSTLWSFMCCLRLPFVRSSFSHNEHLNFPCFSWFFKWWLRFLRSAKFLWHCSHSYLSEVSGILFKGIQRKILCLTRFLSGRQLEENALSESESVLPIF